MASNANNKQVRDVEPNNKQYAYSEIFYSPQGEGHYTGYPTVWLRTFLCNLQCDGFGQDDPTDESTYDLDTINGGVVAGQIIVLKAENTARSIVAKDGTGNLKLSGDFTMDNTEDTLMLVYDGSNWLEVTRSNNGS